MPVSYTHLNPEAAGARKGGAFYESDANKFDLNENGIVDAYDIACLLYTSVAERG